MDMKNQFSQNFIMDFEFFLIDLSWKKGNILRYNVWIYKLGTYFGNLFAVIQALNDHSGIWISREPPVFTYNLYSRILAEPFEKSHWYILHIRMYLEDFREIIIFEFYRWHLRSRYAWMSCCMSGGQMGLFL